MAPFTFVAAAAAAPKYISDQNISFLLVTGVCSGMSILACGFVVLTYAILTRSVSYLNLNVRCREGVSVRLTGDRDRQRFMACVSFLAAIFGLLGNGYDLGVYGSTVAHSVFSFFFNWLVQVCACQSDNACDD